MTSAPGTAPDLARKRCWLFDMDGTLTRAMHDFDAMREALDLPPGMPILEALDGMEPDTAANKRRELDAMELRMASEASVQPGCVALLERLVGAGASLAIVTRNGAEIARVTLEACGIGDFFPPETVISRDCCEPKPAPAGVRLALERLGGSADEAVMVGDYLFDLAAGREAGVRTVHLDVDGGERWPDVTDLRVESLDELHAIVERGA